MEKIKIQDSDLVVGDPLVWSVYGPTGQLLLNEGYILKTDNQKELLLSQDLYRNPTQKEIEEAETQSSADVLEVSPFDTLDQIKGSLRSIMANLFLSVKDDYTRLFWIWLLLCKHFALNRPILP